MPSKKALETKQKFVSDLAADFKDAQSIVFADYLGLTVEQDTNMRAVLRKADVSYQVVKNTLSSRALKEAGFDGLDTFLTGPTAIAYSTKDMISPAKTIKEFADKHEKFGIKGGMLDGKPISAEEVANLARIPGREVLYGQLVFTLLSPITSLAIALNAILEKQQGPTEPDQPEPETSVQEQQEAEKPAEAVESTEAAVAETPKE